MNLHTLKPAAKSTKKSKRLGRGVGSGKGGTSTKGNKGAQSRSGYSSKRGFEGGQMPLQRRLPRFGFNNIHRVEYKAINIGDIQELLEKTKASLVNFDLLYENGLVSKNDLVKILSKGSLNTSVEIQANAFSKSAIEIIEKAGGKAVVVAKNNVAI